MMKKTRNDAIRNTVMSYLERRNYPETDVFTNTSGLNQTAEEMAVSTMVQCESSRSNSILFSCINNDATQCDTQYTRLYNYIKEVKTESVRNELLGILCPLLCHLYLEMLRGGQGSSAQVFLKRHSASLPQRDLSYHQPLDGNLPSALYRPNSLEQLFNSLQNGTIDNDTPEKDYMNQILDEIGSIYSLQDVESRPLVAAFRSCKFELPLSQDSLNVLKSYLAKHGHVLLMQVFQTWFHLDIVTDANQDENDDQTEDDKNKSNHNLNSIDPSVNSLENFNENDVFSRCNGHVDYSTTDKDLRELQEAIKAVRDTVPPLKLYKINSPDANLICAKTDHACKFLCAGFTNSELRIWQIGQNSVKRKHNKNVSTVELACNIPPRLDYPPEEVLQIGAGVALRGHDGPVQATAFMPDQEIVLSTSYDNTMRAWRLSDYSCAAIYRGHNYPIWCLDVSRNGMFIATGSHDKTVRLWSLDRTFPVRIFAGHTFDVTCVKFHPNGAYVASGGGDRTVRLWSVGDGRLVRVLHTHRAPVHALAFSLDGTCLATAGDDKKVKIWDLATSTCIHEYRGHHGKVTALDWAPLHRGLHKAPDANLEGHVLCSAGMDAAVRTWDTQTKRSSSTQEAISSTFNTKCSYLVEVQVHPRWIVAVGCNR